MVHLGLNEEGEDVPSGSTGSASGFHPATTCRICRGSPMLKPAIDGPSDELGPATVVKTVAVASSRFDKFQQAGFVS
jgi:hypothetical protein